MHETTVELGENLRALIRHVLRRQLDPDAAPHEHAGVRVSTSDVLALEELAGGGGAMSQQQLGSLLGLEKSTVSRLAAGLEARGWLVRERDPANRRLYRLALTGEGADVARRVTAEIREHHAELLGRLTAEEREGLRTGLAGLVRVLGEHGGHGGAGHGPVSDGRAG